MIQKTASIYVRIEPEVKRQAEEILSELGIPASNAINMFYKQVILHKGLPFSVTLPQRALPDLSQMSQKAVSEELQKGYDDMIEGRVASADQVFSDIRKDYGM